MSTNALLGFNIIGWPLLIFFLYSQWPQDVSGKDASTAVAMCRMFDAEMVKAKRTGPELIAYCDGGLEIKLKIKND